MFAFALRFRDLFVGAVGGFCFDSHGQWTRPARGYGRDLLDSVKQALTSAGASSAARLRIGGCPMSYSLVSAAAACGINRSTVLRAIKADRISAQGDAQGAWEIMPAELHRVFPPIAAANGGDAPGNGGETALLRTVVDDLRAQVEDLKINRDRCYEAYVATQRMLPPSLPEPTRDDARHRNTLARAWRWLRRPPGEAFAGAGDYGLPVAFKRRAWPWRLRDRRRNWRRHCPAFVVALAALHCPERRDTGAERG